MDWGEGMAEWARSRHHRGATAGADSSSLPPGRRARQTASNASAGCAQPGPCHARLVDHEAATKEQQALSASKSCYN